MGITELCLHCKTLAAAFSKFRTRNFRWKYRSGHTLANQDSKCVYLQLPAGFIQEGFPRQGRWERGAEVKPSSCLDHKKPKQIILNKSQKLYCSSEESFSFSNYFTNGLAVLIIVELMRGKLSCNLCCAPCRRRHIPVKLIWLNVI